MCSMSSIRDSAALFSIICLMFSFIPNVMNCRDNEHTKILSPVTPLILTFFFIPKGNFNPTWSYSLIIRTILTSFDKSYLLRTDQPYVYKLHFLKSDFRRTLSLVVFLVLILTGYVLFGLTPFKEAYLVRAKLLHNEIFVCTTDCPTL